MAIGTPAVGTFTVQTTTATTTPVPYPATVNAGDLLVLTGVTAETAAGNITNPAGWTSVADLVNSGVAPELYVGIKYADGTEGGTSISVTHSLRASSWQLLAFSGVDQVTAQDVAASQFTEASASLNMALPSVTIATTGAALVAVGGLNSATATATPPAGFTETGDLGAGNRAFEVSYELGLAAGATGTQTIVWSASARGVGVLLALRPSITRRPIDVHNRRAIVRPTIF